MNIAKFTKTTVAPVGVSKLNDTIIPVKKQNSEITTELIITPLKFLNNLIDVKDGKIISAEIINFGLLGLMCFTKKSE